MNQLINATSFHQAFQFIDLELGATVSAVLQPFQFISGPLMSESHLLLFPMYPHRTILL